LRTSLSLRPRHHPLSFAQFAGCFYLFGAFCGAAIVWMWFSVPETRGKSLEEIETMLREGRIQ
jgi:hypothetical protein